MSDTELGKELGLAMQAYGLGLADLEKLTMNAMKSAFAPHEMRVELMEKVLVPGVRGAGGEGEMRAAEQIFQGEE